MFHDDDDDGDDDHAESFEACRLEAAAALAETMRRLTAALGLAMETAAGEGSTVNPSSA